MNHQYLYTFGQLYRRFYITIQQSWIVEYNKGGFISHEVTLPKDIQIRRPQESVFRMSKGVKLIIIIYFTYNLIKL